MRTFVVIGLLAVTIACYRGNRPPRIGSNAPDFTIHDSDHSITLHQFRGNIVLLNFWASWCPPCVEETPSLIQMQDRLRPKGVIVVAVSIDVDEAAYYRFLKLYKVNMITVREPSQKTAGLFGTHGWPETYAIDRTGTIRRKFVGPVDWNSPEIIQFLSRL